MMLKTQFSSGFSGFQVYQVLEMSSSILKQRICISLGVLEGEMLFECLIVGIII